MASTSEKIEWLFLRVASASSADQLQSFLNKSLLDSVSLTSNTSDENVRKQGMELLAHVNNRIKADERVQLPMDKLFETFQTSPANSLASNLFLIYLKTGFKRMAAKDRIVSLPNLLHSASGKPIRQINEIFSVAAPVFIDLIVTLKQNEWPDLNISADKILRNELISFFMDVLLLPPMSRAENLRSAIAPAGMSDFGYERVCHLQVDKDDLKCKLLKLIGSGLFTEREKLPLIVVGLSNSAHFVVSTAKLEWNKIDLTTVLEDKLVIRKLFELYLGTVDAKNVVKEEQKSPASLQLRLKILPALVRSGTAATMFPENVKLALDGLFGRQQMSVARPFQLQFLSVQFLSNIAEKCPQNLLPVFGPILFSALQKLIDNCEHIRVVAVAYQSLGIIGKRCPNLIIKNMSLIQETFDAIPTAPNEVSSAIVGCLVSWLPAFKSLNDPSAKGILEALIGSYIVHDSHECRLVSLKYIESLLECADPQLRWLLCSAYGDSRDDIRREALRLLEISLKNASFVPSFESIVCYFAMKLQPSENAKRDFSPLVSNMAVLYAFACLTVEAAVTPQLDLLSDGDDSFLEFAKIGKVLKMKAPEIVQSFASLALHSLRQQTDVQLFRILILTVTVCTASIQSFVLELSEWLKTFLQNSSQSLSASVIPDAAHLFAISLPKENVLLELDHILSQFTDNLQKCTVCEVWTVGYLAECVESEREKILQIENLLLASSLSRLPLLVEPSLKSLALCLAKHPILVSDQVNNQISTMGRLISSRQDSVKVKTKEAFLLVLSRLSSVFCQEALFDRLLSLLAAVGEGPPQPELQFNVGDALFDATLAEWSPSRRNFYRETEADYLAKMGEMDEKISERVRKTLDMILKEGLGAGSWQTRQAALIWLYVLVKRGATFCPPIQNALNRIQDAFVEGLTESNDFSQDVASRGLGAVYELANSDQKQSMLSVLVDSLTLGRKSQSKMTDSTKVFEKAVKTPAGESMSTYRELCALATDMNQPDLIYKFMQLASHNAMWNSKRGAAFGFGAVLEQAKDEMELHLPYLVPKLYRYRFDPEAKVQSSMRAIWQSLLGSRKAVVDEFANAIFEESFNSLIQKQWRVRESGCRAISDILSGHSTKQMEKQFPELLDRLFRVQDDVKESVRKAADHSLKTLTGLISRKCSSSASDASELIGSILPVLIEKGIKSNLKASRAISLATICSLTKEAGAALKPHISIICVCLLEAISEGESSLLNYLAVRASDQHLEQLDTARTSAAKKSPMMNALYDCIPYIDSDVLTQLLGQLSQLLRSSVGLSTRTATCQFVITICLRCQRDLIQVRPLCDKLLQALLSGLKDRNVTVRKTYASAIGYLSKFCSDKYIRSALHKMRNDYIALNDADDTIATTFVLRSLASNNLEYLKNYADILAPLILLAKFAPVGENATAKEIVEIWDEIWTELVPGTEGGIRLYEKEIVSFACGLIRDSQIWTVRASAAKMLALVGDIRGAKMAPHDAHKLYDSLTETLSGRTVEGKEQILIALSCLLEKSGPNLKLHWNDHQLTAKKFSVLLTECKRQKREYRATALACAAVFVECLSYSEGAVTIVDIIDSLLREDNNLEKFDCDDEKGKSKQMVDTKMLEALGHAAVALETESHMKTVCSLLTHVLETAFWKIKISALASLLYLFKGWPAKINLLSDGTSLFKVLTETLQTTSNTVLADNCVKTLEQLLLLSIDGKIVIDYRTNDSVKRVAALRSSEPCQKSLTFLHTLAKVGV